MEHELGKSKVERVIDLLYSLIQWICVICLAGQVVVITWAVFGRFVLNNTPSWAEEVSKILMVWMSLMAAALAVKDDTHVRMTIFDKLFGPLGLKIRNTIFALLNIFFCGVLFWKGLDLIEQTSRTKLPGSGLPSSVLYGSVCIGGLAMTIMLLYQLGRTLCQRK
ncbi:TRAP transporter small permease [Oscillibacter hominis]|uniref:TRAP transporter small permease n=1 Tax=Oscillibacter hominis TaxID=2763056 RepID=A0A7G9B399_9FIRM|nr:TRAP transporter small permease [Oscillibacter hominis]QNL44030.1 TRAP transporter small permease [Oscillibacter hominis]